MRVITALLLFLIVNAFKSGDAQGLRDVLGTIKDDVVGVIGGAIDVIPDLPEAVDLGKQVILGLPWTALSTGASILCSLAESQDAIQTRYVPEIENIQFQFRTACNIYTYPVTEAADIANNTEFDVSKKTVIVATGWTTTVNDTLTNTVRILSKAYNCRGDYNYLALDDAKYLQTLYTWSAVNTQLIAEFMAVGLQQLSEVIPFESIHLIGHSLGAHLVGVAGRHFTELTGNKLKHITGLDPAGPCFKEGEQLEGIFRGDAEFVDIIHTTPGTVGELSPLGDADFYAGGYRPLKPGCLEPRCSHNIAGDYYAETVYPNNEHNFMARRCSSLVALTNDFCRGKDIPMGFAVPHDAKGFYFLELNAKEPYGTNATAAFQSSDSECGKCPS